MVLQSADSRSISDRFLVAKGQWRGWRAVQEVPGSQRRGRKLAGARRFNAAAGSSPRWSIWSLFPSQTGWITPPQ